MAKKIPLCEVRIKNLKESPLTFCGHIFMSGDPGLAKLHSIEEIKMLGILIENETIVLIDTLPKGLLEFAGLTEKPLANEVMPESIDTTDDAINESFINPSADSILEPSIIDSVSLETDTTSIELTDATEINALDGLEVQIISNTDIPADTAVEKVGNTISVAKNLTSEIVNALEKSKLLSVAKQLVLEVNRDTNVPTLKNKINDFLASGITINFDDTDPANLVVTIAN